MSVSRPSAETYTAERCYITEWLNSPEDPACSIAQARVTPGTTTQLHALRGIVERYVILSGTGRMRVGDAAPFDVSASTVISIPANTSQQITNTGSADLIFLCLCTPRFLPEAYQNLE